MLSKNRRIERKDFSIVLKGMRDNSPHFVVYIKKTEKEKPSLFSFSVPKKVYNKAVDRNRLRRQGYSVVRKYIKDVRDGFMCFFLFKKGQYPMSFNVLDKEIYNVLYNNKIISL